MVSAATPRVSNHEAQGPQAADHQFVGQHMVAHRVEALAGSPALDRL
jgi:hypothetical protein